MLETLGSQAKEKFMLDSLEFAKTIRRNNSGPRLIDWEKIDKTILIEAGVLLTQFWYDIPDKTKAEITTHILQWADQFSSKIPAIISNSWSSLPKAFGTMDDALKRFNIPVPALKAGDFYLTYTVCNSINAWYEGKISGKRTAQYIIDGMGATTGGIVGAAAGGALMTKLAPGCLRCQSIAVAFGATCGSYASSYYINMLTTEIFDLPKEVVVENAYDYLGVHHRASNEEVNNAYDKLCLENHPEMGGNPEEFLKLQSYMGVIMAHRETLR